MCVIVCVYDTLEIYIERERGKDAFLSRGFLLSVSSPRVDRSGLWHHWLAAALAATEHSKPGLAADQLQLLPKATCSLRSFAMFARTSRQYSIFI